MSSTISKNLYFLIKLIQKADNLIILNPINCKCQISLPTLSIYKTSVL